MTVSVGIPEVLLGYGVGMVGVRASCRRVRSYALSELEVEGKEKKDEGLADSDCDSDKESPAVEVGTLAHTLRWWLGNVGWPARMPSFDRFHVAV